jgi:hypothetical protein
MCGSHLRGRLRIAGGSFSNNRHGRTHQSPPDFVSKYDSEYYSGDDREPLIDQIAKKKLMESSSVV